MSLSYLITTIALATATSAAPATGGSVTIAQPADFKKQADALLQASYSEDGPGAAVVVMRGGRVIYAGGRGLADLESRRPITPDTSFRLGSIAKQFTAATILQLVGEGKLSLDDPISRFLPGYPPPGAGASVRQLLNHSSGVQDFSKIPGWMGSEPSLRPHSTADLVALTLSRPAVSAPGQRWEYNNGGYVLLGAIIEKVTGKAWHEAVTERIARPLGLGSLAYAAAGSSGSARARGYSKEAGGFRPSRGVHMSVAHAAGGLVATVADMAKWAEALHGGRVVSPALYREMISPARLADGSTEPYGFGLRLQKIRGRAAFVHGGAGRGLDTDSVYVPSERLFVAVFANSDDLEVDPSNLTRRLAALALGEPFPAFTPTEVDIASVEPLFGAYTAEEGPQRRFFARNGKLYFGRGDEEREAFAAGGDRFFFGPRELDWFEVIRQPGGAHRLKLHAPEAAAPAQAVRSGPVPPPLAVAPAVLQSYVGSYKTETVTLAVALGGDGRLTVSPAGQPPMPLRPVSQTEFRIEGAPMRLVFHPEEGKVNRLTLYRGARELHGQRTAQ